MAARTALGSPWLEQLNRAREVRRLHGNAHTNIAIIGAGIAGISTAYFLLTRTWKRVMVLEGDRVAHGATGHNAGQLVSYFERPFTDIANEFGLQMAADGQRDVESAWELLAEMRRTLEIQTPCHIFTGYAGCTDDAELLVHLRNNEARHRAGLPVERIAVSSAWSGVKHLPRTLRKFFILVPHHTILNLLETNDTQFIAALAGKKGVMNSARFCEEVISKLLAKYPRRLTLVEHAPVSTVSLFRHHAELHVGHHAVRAKHVVLCTNGFERMHIENHHGANIDVKFHHLVRGSVGYMAAFTEEPQMTPTAVSYLPAHHGASSGAYDSDPYFYLTRRPHGNDMRQSLVCVGGPEALMDDTNNYSKSHPYPNEAKKLITAFLKKTYRHTGRRLTYTHLWHGLMGYTPNGIRCVGAEPCNPVLLYNLGCNGVGILPSIFAGKRITQILQKKHLLPSIFDPADVRCFLQNKPPEKKRVVATPWFGKHTVWGCITFWCLATCIALAAYWMRAAVPVEP